MAEHVQLDVGQLEEGALPVPHLLHDHLTHSHCALVHIQTGCGVALWAWGGEGVGRKGGRGWGGG